MSAPTIKDNSLHQRQTNFTLRATAGHITPAEVRKFCRDKVISEQHSHNEHASCVLLPWSYRQKILYFCLMGLPADLQRQKPPQMQLPSPHLALETEKRTTVWGEKNLMEMCWNNWGLSLVFIKGRFHSSYWSSLRSLGIKARIEMHKVLFFLQFSLILKESPEEQSYFTAQVKCDPESVSLSILVY